MNRREFVALSATAMGLSAANAQSADKTKRLGLLIGGKEGDGATYPGLVALSEALQQLGWREGLNLSLSRRYAESRPELMAQFAKELVKFDPDVIIAHTTPVVEALMRETAVIPIVFVICFGPAGQRFCSQLHIPRKERNWLRQHRSFAR